MRGTRRFLALLPLLVLISLANQAGAIDISAVGSWSPTTGASDLILGAGSELKDSYESEVDQMVVAISNTAGVFTVVDI